MDYHGAAFTGLQAWLAKQPPEQRDQTLDLWRSVLANVTLDAARDATELLFSGEVECPKFYDDHPRAVLRAIRESRKEAGGERYPDGKWVTGEDGERVYAFHCHHCEDTGFVGIWLPGAFRCHKANPEAFKQFQDGHWVGETNEWCWHISTLRCTCKRGQAFASAWLKVQYDPSMHARIFKDERGNTVGSLTGWGRPAPVAEEFDARSYQFQD